VVGECSNDRCCEPLDPVGTQANVAVSMEAQMWVPGRFILELAAGLITTGGLYDVLTPRLPSNLAKICGANQGAQKLTRELLRALGGALIALGAGCAYMVTVAGANPDPSILVLILVLVVLSQLINAICMFRAGSPFYFPLAFASLRFWAWFYGGRTICRDLNWIGDIGTTRAPLYPGCS
jgi:hypothetical protein